MVAKSESPVDEWSIPLSTGFQYVSAIHLVVLGLSLSPEKKPDATGIARRSAPHGPPPGSASAARPAPAVAAAATTGLRGRPLPGAGGNFGGGVRPKKGEEPVWSPLT